jgi:hypothetical protein
MRRRLMAPWEEITYFDTPKVTFLTLPGSGEWYSFVPANPQRVALVFSCPGGVYISTDNTVPLTAGFQFTTTTYPLSITEAQHGPLCTAEWFANGTTNQLVTAFEVILRQMPEESS